MAHSPAPESISFGEILSVFPDANPPKNSSEDVAQIAATADGCAFLRNLTGKRWTAVASPESFWKTESDPITWLVAMPKDWFAYYLPAMLAVCTSEDSPRATNLRTSLRSFLVLGRHSTDLNRRVHRELENRLSAAQQELVARFTRLYP